MSKLDFKYYHFGTDKLYKELWLNVHNSMNDKNYVKPIGGLWTSHFDPHFLSEWLRYKYSTDYLSYDEYVSNKKSSLIKFKDEAKLLCIESKNDFQNLKDSGFVVTLEKPIELNSFYGSQFITEIPDYEKISEYYDLLYVDNLAHNSLKQYSIETMLVLNPEAISYYVGLDTDNIKNKILKTSNDKKISNPSKEYYNFLLQVRNMFQDIKSNNYDEFLYKLKLLRNNIIVELKNNYNFNSLKLPKDFDYERLIYVTVYNICSEKNKEAKKLYKKI